MSFSQQFHIVQKGETYFTISKMYNTDCFNPDYANKF